MKKLFGEVSNEQKMVLARAWARRMKRWRKSMSDIDIMNMDKAAILVALYNHARPLGLGAVHFDPTPMTRDEAIELIVAHRGKFDYVRGRPLKIQFEGDVLKFAQLYDRDQGGEGTCARIVDGLRK